MNFKSLNISSLAKLIDNLKLGVMHHVMWGTVFYEVYPNQTKKMPLKERYKPSTEAPGLYSIYQAQVRMDVDGKEKANAKLNENRFYGQFYQNQEASLKLHVSLNNIGDLDEKVIQGLIRLLIEESESPHNSMNFFFKIIDPERTNLERFANNDQLTIYFDKYSSAADMAQLADKIEAYLVAQNVPENQQGLGPKDSFGFNSFVSARFDTNKLLNLYDVYPFFDMELQKFFTTNLPEEIKHIPLCAFEAVFNYIIMSEEITVLPKEPRQGLNEEDSQKVQNELAKMKADPRKYMNKVESLQSSASEPSTQDEQKQVVDVSATLRNYWMDILKFPQAKPASIYVISEDDLRLIEQKAPEFYEAIKKIHEKSVQLTEKDPEKAKVAETLYHELVVQYLNFDKQRDFQAFKEKCAETISQAKPILEKHSGWKEVFFNVLAIIGTLGGSAAYQYYKRKDVFFKVNTDSANIVEGIEGSIDDLGPKRGG